MGLSALIRALFESGRVGVERYHATIPTDEWAEAELLLRDWDDANRRDFPGDAPPFNVDVARWAAAQFYSACQFAVYRDLDAAAMTTALSPPCPEAPAATQHYTTDLVYRFLPDLLRLARTAAEGDPLCDRLRQGAALWPLSSVGVGGVQIEPLALTAVCEHPGLLRVYVDRIVAKGDVSRLGDPRVRSAVRIALGWHDDLAPSVAAALKKYDESTPLDPINS